jgi:hypothetical protein
MKYAFAALISFGLWGCTGTGQPDVSFPAYYVPTATNSFVLDDVTIQLSEARIAFGPAYFCASSLGSATLCETALGEILDDVGFDGLSPEQQIVGTYHGFVGEVRSVSYDHGIHWFLPQQDARPSEAAPEGHSLVIRGEASRAGVEVPFEVFVDVVPQYRGQRAVPTVPVEGTITEATRGVEMRVDLESWLTPVDYEEMLASGANPFVIKAGDVSHDAIIIRMSSNAPVKFSFVQ